MKNDPIKDAMYIWVRRLWQIKLRKFCIQSLAIHHLMRVLRVRSQITQYSVASLTQWSMHCHKHVLPCNVIYMAENCQVHSGECLCKCALQHTWDAGTPDILSDRLAFAKHGHEICLIISHKVLALMKTILYSASSAITAVDFLAAQCSCKAGCKNDGPLNLGLHCVVCTHGITLLVQMSQLMF